MQVSLAQRFCLLPCPLGYIESGGAGGSKVRCLGVSCRTHFCGDYDRFHDVVDASLLVLFCFLLDVALISLPCTVRTP
jgi:hypothetical protein